MTADTQRLALQEAGKQVKILIAVYEGYASHSVVSQSLVMLCIRYVYVLLLLIMLNIRRMHLEPTCMG